MATLNRLTFQAKLEGMAEADRRHVQQVADVQDPIVDSYGRVTFFYTKIGGVRIPLYQPGTVMFESAVVQDSSLQVVSKGSQ